MFPLLLSSLGTYMEVSTATKEEAGHVQIRFAVCGTWRPMMIHTSITRNRNVSKNYSEVVFILTFLDAQCHTSISGIA